ncbi:MAG: multidrug ABC transporter substrate-binding protein [Firmicutes bacterium HGW-Firmicutes-15]|nr:MAG: multidrug ABC transporter substrate-binding protein [Firmicutes bacterium HGW-Firmicutes-15]
MNIKETFRVSIRAIKANGMRSFLTMLGIIIGVSAVILLVSLGQGASNSITDQIQGLGSNLLIVTPGNMQEGMNTGATSTNTLTISDAEAIANQSSVKYVAPYIRKNIQVSFRNKDYTTALEGTTDQYAQVRNVKMEKGRFFSKFEVLGESNVAVVGSEVVKKLFDDPNADVIGRQIEINQLPLTIIGILETQGSQGMQNNDDVVILPITTVMNRMFGDKNISMIYLSAGSEKLMNKAQQDAATVLRIQHSLTIKEDNDFTITNQAQILNTAQGITGIMTALLAGIAGISLAVGGIGIMNIMLVSVTERTREIGIRKAIGANRKVILAQFLTEAVMLSLLGGIIGILLGIGSAAFIGAVSPLPTAITVTPVVYSFVFAMMVGVVFGVYPARKAASLNPIDALRYE